MTTDIVNAGLVQSIQDAVQGALERTLQKMTAVMQRPTIIASESGADSLKLGNLASGKIQWELKLYKQPGEDRYQFIEDGAYIADQIAAFYTDHKPGEPIAIKLERAPRALQSSAD